MTNVKSYHIVHTRTPDAGQVAASLAECAAACADTSKSYTSKYFIYGRGSKCPGSDDDTTLQENCHCRCETGGGDGAVGETCTALDIATYNLYKISKCFTAAAPSTAALRFPARRRSLRLVACTVYLYSNGHQPT